jgi:hypothetical protein
LGTCSYLFSGGSFHDYFRNEFGTVVFLESLHYFLLVLRPFILIVLFLRILKWVLLWFIRFDPDPFDCFSLLFFLFFLLMPFLKCYFLSNFPIFISFFHLFLNVFFLLNFYIGKLLLLSFPYFLFPPKFIHLSYLFFLLELDHFFFLLELLSLRLSSDFDEIFDSLLHFLFGEPALLLVDSFVLFAYLFLFFFFSALFFLDGLFPRKALLLLGLLSFLHDFINSLLLFCVVNQLAYQSIYRMIVFKVVIKICLFNFFEEFLRYILFELLIIGVFHYGNPNYMDSSIYCFLSKFNPITCFSGNVLSASV